LAEGAPILGILPPPVAPLSTAPALLIEVLPASPLVMTSVEAPAPVPAVSRVIPYVAPYYKPKPERN
jgi:hypothetical protein